MTKKTNILSRALMKLKLMEKQMVEESQVLDELKEKEEKENLSHEFMGKAAEFSAAPDTERAEAETVRIKAKNEIRELNETIRNIHNELEKIRSENAAIKVQLNSSLVKITEQDIFSKSAASALKENEEELQPLRDRMEYLSNELSKNKADSLRRLEILRLELDEKNRHLARLGRELETNKAEKENLKSELGLASGQLTLSLKEKEEAYKTASDAMKLEITAREQTIASLGKEIEKHNQDNEKLAAELTAKAGEFKTLLHKERDDFKAAYSKLELEAAAGEKELLNELQALKEGANHKNAEFSRLNGELKDAKDGYNILKKELETGTAKTVELGAELKNLRNNRDILRKNEESLLKRMNELGLANQHLTLSLKEKEEAHKNAAEAAKLALTAREQTIASLGKEIEKHARDNEKLAAELQSGAAQFKALNEYVNNKNIELDRLSAELKNVAGKLPR